MKDGVGEVLIGHVVTCMWPKAKIIDVIQTCFTSCHSFGLKALGGEGSRKTTASFARVALRGFLMHCTGLCFAYFQQLNQTNHLQMYNKNNQSVLD